MADILTLAEYKTLMGITSVDATRDSRISAFLPIITDEVKEYCNNDFLVQTGDTYPYTETETYPAGLKMPFARMVAYQLDNAAKAGIQSESQGGYSYSMGGNTGWGGYPAEILKALDKYKLASVGYAQSLQKFDQEGYVPADRTRRIL